MKKLLLSLAIAVANFSFGQITLKHSFADTEIVFAYSKGNEMFYISRTVDNKLKIYNTDYSLKKIVNVPIPSGYELQFTAYSDYDGNPFAITQHIFNNDDKYEFLIQANYYNQSSQINYYKLMLINEDGDLIKDFHPNPETKKFGELYNVYHDLSNNINKLIVYNWVNGWDNQTDIYELPSSELTTKEIESIKKLSAFPIPTNKTLNIFNPGNGVNKVEVYDVSGKAVLSRSFNINDNRISIDVENLPKGTYVYKIGNVSSKFIKN